jgi:ADP-heptose:LPS heptosyltransferase
LPGTGILITAMNWKIEGLKRVDGIFGKLACSASRLIATPRITQDTKSPKILVIRPGGIGDAVLLYPALRELRAEFPESLINVLAEKRNSGVLAFCPYVDNVILYDERSLSRLNAVIRGMYDIVIDTEQWHRLTAALAYMTGAPVRAGFQTNERVKLYSVKVPYNQDDYEALSFLNLVSAVTEKHYEFKQNEPFIPLDLINSSGIDSSLGDFRKNKKALVGIFAGATVPERRWGVSKFAELTKKLAAMGMGAVILGGKEDLENSSEIKSTSGSENVIDYTAKTTLAETAYIISKLDLMVSGDTGLMHLAYGVGTPTVALFVAGIEEKWAPQGKNHIAINKRLSCSPCTKFGYTPPCPYDVKCLNDITVEEVLLTVQKIHSGRKKKKVT